MDNDNRPVISVIVPVYNVEKYLGQCIDSILKQSFQNFELLLIDDGSPDESGKICDEYAAKDGRVRVFHKENGGVSSARNVGLDNAAGQWVAFQCFRRQFYDIAPSFGNTDIRQQRLRYHAERAESG